MPALPAAERARLEAAYRATTYRIHAPQGDIDLRIGKTSPVLAELLCAADAECWAILTAWNPVSCAKNVAANTVAQARLQQWLAAAGYVWLAGENLADAGDWPVEESCVALGMTEREARRCGSVFGQHAVVTGGRDAVPQLLWCDGHESSPANRSDDAR